MPSTRLRIIQTLGKGFAAIVLLGLAGCASFPENIRPGMQHDELVARFGKPSVERTDRRGRSLLIYSTAPLGQRAYAARLDASGTVTRVDQVLTLTNFATIVVGQWDTEQVLVHFGPPSETSRVQGYQVWGYRYRESEAWNSMFNVMFDDAGVVRQTQNGPDPMYEVKGGDGRS